MKKLRIALIVICSIFLLFKLMDLLTEHNNKKEFLAQAEAFAQATSGGDYETANTYNKHPFEVDLDSVDDNVKRMYEIIEGSMDYEIHTGDAIINNDVRRVDITFTMVDYKGIYETMSFPTMEEYITALENSDKTVTIDVVFYRLRADSSHPYSYRTDSYYPAVFLEDGIYSTVDKNFRDLISFYSIIPKTDWA